MKITAKTVKTVIISAAIVIPSIATATYAHAIEKPPLERTQIIDGLYKSLTVKVQMPNGRYATEVCILTRRPVTTRDFIVTPEYTCVK